MAERPVGRSGAGLALAALSVGVFVSGLDQTVVVAVLPQIITDLHVPITDLDEAAWIVTAYLLGYTVAMPALARAADVYGYRALFAVCAALFAVGSWWAAVANGLWPLMAARAVQALGGGGMVPVALAAAAALYGGRARVLALGAIAGAAEAGAVLGRSTARSWCGSSVSARSSGSICRSSPFCCCPSVRCCGSGRRGWAASTTRVRS